MNNNMLGTLVMNNTLVKENMFIYRTLLSELQVNVLFKLWGQETIIFQTVLWEPEPKQIFLWGHPTSSNGEGSWDWGRAWPNLVNLENWNQ